MQILLAISENYVDKAKNLIKNILCFHRMPLTIAIIYASENFSEAEMHQQFSEFDSASNLKLLFKRISAEERSHYEQASSGLDNSLNLRLYVSLLPLSGKIIYLDTDILVADELTELYHTDLQGKSIAAVPDCFVIRKNYVTQGKYFAEKLKMGDFKYDGKEHSYFNSGVMLIDLDLLKQQNTWLKQLPQLHNFPRLQDQCFLNYIHQDDVVYLEDRWNFLINQAINTRFYLVQAGWLIEASKLNLNFTKVKLTVEEKDSSPQTSSLQTSALIAVKSPAELKLLQQKSSLLNNQQELVSLLNRELNLPLFTGQLKFYPAIIHFAGSNKSWNPQAQEWYALYREIADLQVTEIYNLSVAEYKEKFVNCLIAGGYSQWLSSQNNLDDLFISDKDLKQAYKNLCNYWSFSPLLVNKKLIAPHFLTTIWNNLFVSDKRKKLNARIMEYLKSTRDA